MVPSSCSVAQLSIWLFPCTHCNFATGLSKHSHLGPVPTDLINMTYARMVIQLQESGRKLFSRGFVLLGDQHLLALSGSISSWDTLCVWAYTHLLPLGMLFQQLKVWGCKGIKRLDCSLLLSFGKLLPIKIHVSFFCHFRLFEGSIFQCQDLSCRIRLLPWKSVR